MVTIITNAAQLIRLPLSLLLLLSFFPQCLINPILTDLVFISIDSNMSSALEAGDPALHRKSVGQIEINGPGGRRKTVDLSDLSQADRELAEKFGYNPVRDYTRIAYHLRLLTFCCIGVQA